MSDHNEENDFLSNLFPDSDKPEMGHPAVKQAMWQQFISIASVVSLRTLLESLPQSDKIKAGIIDAWRTSLVQNLNQELENQKKLQKSPFGMLFGKVDETEFMERYINSMDEVEAQAREALFAEDPNGPSADDFGENDLF